MKSKRINTIVAAVMGAIGRFIPWFNKGNHYADPHLQDPHHKQRSRIGTKANRHGNKRLSPTKIRPGTIAYQDWLVRELGYDRRLADGYLYAYRNGYNVKMPMPSDLRI